jgi:hypothetical protein
MDNIQEEIQLIQDSYSLAVFLKNLEQDFLADKESWENWSLDQYIASVSGWVEDGGLDMVIKDKPLNPFQSVAVCMYMGKIYE